MAHAKRNSIGSQLPLPTTIALPDSPLAPSFPPPRTPPPAAATVPLPHGATFSGTHPLPLNASNILLHNTQFNSQQSSTTHAGGIQPSASFFKPRKPSDYSPGLGASTQRYPHPSSMGLQDADEEFDDLHDDTQQRRNSNHLAIPHPLSPTFSTGTLSPSLSQHQHHHSNHSLEDVREHEDRGLTPSDTEDASGQRKNQVHPKLSREPLIDAPDPSPSKGLVLTIPGTPSRVTPASGNVLTIGGNTSSNVPGSPRNLSFRAQSPTSSSAPKFGLIRTVFSSGQAANGGDSRRNSQDLSQPTGRASLDASINTKKTKRNSLVYKPRLTFESLRRNSTAQGDGSRRGSYITTDEGTDEEQGLHIRGPSHRHPLGVDDIPLTPTKSGSRSGHGRSEDGTHRKSRSHMKQSSFAPSAASSRSPSSSSVRSSSMDHGGASTPTPALFNPTPPPLRPGEAPLMKTPLRHPLAPSLIPAAKLEREMDLRTRARAKKRRRMMEKVVGRKGGEKGSELPTIAVTTISSQSSKPASEEGAEKPGKLAKRYELHPSRNVFFNGGKVLTGGDSPWAFIACLIVVFGFVGVWFGTTGVWWWREAGRAKVAISLGDPPPVGLDGFDFQRRPVGIVGVEGRDWSWVTVDPNARRAGKAIVIVCAYLASVVISSMMVTAFSDPGILPRGLDPDPPCPATSPSDGGERLPMPRDLKVRDDVVRVKYCPTCKTYRPPRASHCKMCDNCVDGCDHHCQWVNNCVGARNYTMFIVMLSSATLTLILIITTAALHLWFLTVWQNYTFKEALAHGPGSAVAFSLAIVVICPVGALLSYHLRLLLLNITTIEQIRNQAHKTLVPGPPPPNPFSHGSWRKNFIAVLCRPQTLSWLDPSAVATEDRREVNPGMFPEALGDSRGPSERPRQRAKDTGLNSARSDVSGWDTGLRFAQTKEGEDDDEGN